MSLPDILIDIAGSEVPKKKKIIIFTISVGKVTFF